MAKESFQVATQGKRSQTEPGIPDLEIKLRIQKGHSN